MYRFFRFVTVLLAVVTTACSEQYFISDPVFRAEVSEQFEKRRAELSGGAEDVFAVFNRSDLSTVQREALEFMYAYSPLCDVANYDGEFFLSEIDLAFRIRDHFEWGATVPEDIFRDFVMPSRANAEYLDTCRVVFFNELKDRVTGMTMMDAALEVNHWCHEKVTYRGTDRRTSANLALVKTSWGRCGEEAAFATAAMRSVGIPSRVAMTPRWAHTDDNHAWIEVWVDGKWYYMGACEPEPELNVAWFDGPVKRAMMVLTTVMGPYQGDNEVNFRADLYTRINLLDNYTATRKVDVTVTDTNGAAVAGANVKFKVYNSADLYPIYEGPTDAEGRIGLTTGKGDLVVWASKGGRYGYVKCTPEIDSLTVVLDRVAGSEYTEKLRIDPPAEQPAVELAEEAVAENRVRLAYEDSVRTAYMGTFVTEEQAALFAETNGLDKAKVWKYLQASQGNHAEIEEFMLLNKGCKMLFPFLATLADKDLRDTPAAYLTEHLHGAYILVDGFPDEFVAENILSPRIGWEIISPWRSYFESKDVAKANELYSAEDVANYVKNNIRLSGGNYYACPLTPIGVHRVGAADRASRDVYFVALCRYMSIPARIEKTTGKVQYWNAGQWIDVVFEQNFSDKATPQGTLTLTNDPSNIILPSYGTHFSIARFNGSDFATLNFYGAPEMKSFPAKVKLDEGYYRIIVASRANDGSVTADVRYVNIEEGKSYVSNVKLLDLGDKLLVKGVIDMNAFVMLEDRGKTSLKDLADNKGLVICFADPDKEPTKHVLQDLPAHRKALEEWGGGILFLVPDDKQSASFDPSQFPGLPAQTEWATDEGRQKLREAASALKLNFGNNFPLIVYVTKSGGILFDSQGYRIGIGETLLRTINRERESNDKK